MPKTRPPAPILARCTEIDDRDEDDGNSACRAGSRYKPSDVNYCRRRQDTRLRVKVFPGPRNLALFTSQERSFFAKRRLAFEIQFTTNSQELRDAIAAVAGARLRGHKVAKQMTQTDYARSDADPVSMIAARRS
jgi:hypothetical protein